MYKKCHLLQKPECIFVVTELKIAAYPRASAYVACNARATPLAPFVIFHSDPVDTSRLTAYSLPEFKDALFLNAKGTHDGDALFLWFRDHFLHFKNRYHGHSVILFVGCPVSELSLRLVQLAEEAHVVLVSVSSTVAHLVQPLSSDILRSLNAAVSAGVEQLVTDGKLASDVTVSRSLLATLLAEVWADKWSYADVTEAFASCGIFPLNVRAITADRITAATTRDNASDTCVMNESGEDDEDITHGLNLLSELSTLEQQKETCTERLIDPQHYENKKLNIIEIVDDASAIAGSVHNCLLLEKPKVSREVLKCFVDEDTSTHAYSDISSSAICQPYMSAAVDCQSDCDTKTGICGTECLISTTDSMRLSNRTSSTAHQSDSHSVNDNKSGFTCDERHDDCVNSRQKNVATRVGRKVVDTALTDVRAGHREVRHKPGLTDTRLNEPNNYAQSVFCNNVPVCCEPPINVHNSNVDSTLQVIYLPSVGSSMRINIDQDDSDRTEGTQIELDVGAACDVDDSCQHVFCEVII